MAEGVDKREMQAERGQERYQLLYEYGVAANLDPVSKRIELKPPFWLETFASSAEFIRTYNLQPLCMLDWRQHYELIHPIEVLPDGSVNDLMEDYIALAGLVIKYSGKLSGNLAPDVERVCFWVRAMKYHLQSLTKGYIEVLTAFYDFFVRARFTFEGSEYAIPAFGHLARIWSERHPGEALSISDFRGSGDSLFYEIIAFLTTGRILLDSLLPILRARKTVHIKIPNKHRRSFHQFMKRIDQCTLPAQLDAALRSAWQGWLERFINFRNWVIHAETRGPSHWVVPYFSVILHSRDSVLGLFLRLPDNPPADPNIPNWPYRFEQRLDGLKYVNDVYCQLLKLCLFVLTDTLEEMQELESS